MPHLFADDEAPTRASIDTLLERRVPLPWKTWSAAASVGLGIAGLALIMGSNQPQSAAGGTSMTPMPPDAVAQNTAPNSMKRVHVHRFVFDSSTFSPQQPSRGQLEVTTPPRPIAVEPVELPSDTPAMANAIPTMRYSVDASIAEPTHEPTPTPAEVDVAAAPTEVAAAPADEPKRRGIVGPFNINIQGDEKHVVVLIDASGSMIDRLPMVLKETNSFIRRLPADQKFNVIAFASGDVVKLFDESRVADRDAKLEARNWLDPRKSPIRASGRTTLLPAIRYALRDQPDHLILIGDAPSAPRLASDPARNIDPLDGDTVHALLQQISYGPAGKAVISTVEITDEPQLATPSILARIAHHQHGEHRLIAPAEAEIERSRMVGVPLPY